MQPRPFLARTIESDPMLLERLRAVVPPLGKVLIAALMGDFAGTPWQTDTVTSNNLDQAIAAAQQVQQ